MTAQGTAAKLELCFVAGQGEKETERKGRETTYPVRRATSLHRKRQTYRAEKTSMQDGEEATTKITGKFPYSLNQGGKRKGEKKKHDNKKLLDAPAASDG